MSDDVDLLARWRDGDPQAGQRLFERYFDLVSRFFVNKVPHDHEDLIQETFAACVRGRDRIRNDASFRSYLFSTAYNVLKTYYQRNARPGQAQEELESCAAGDLAPGPSTLLRAHEQEERLLEALRRIPLELQVVLEMRYWENMSSTEIGQALGIPAGTVRTRMLRGREKLATVLHDRLRQRDQSASAMADLDEWAGRVRQMMESDRSPKNG